jgi:hypothetical protein
MFVAKELDRPNNKRISRRSRLEIYNDCKFNIKNSILVPFSEGVGSDFREEQKSTNKSPPPPKKKDNALLLVSVFLFFA